MVQDDVIWEKAAMPGWEYLDVRNVENIQEYLKSIDDKEKVIIHNSLNALLDNKYKSNVSFFS